LRLVCGTLVIPALLLCAMPVRADYAVLRSGHRLHITGHERLGEQVKLHLHGGFAVIAASELLRIEPEDFLLLPAPARRTGETIPFGELIAEAARRNGLDPALVASVIAVESRFDPRAVSRKNAQGLMQLLPVTAARLGVRDPFNPQENVAAGTRYLAELLERFSGDLRLALAAYNAGPERVEQFRGVPPFRETQDYVERVLAEYRQRKIAVN
jgi:hypothetical protein